MPMHDWTRVEPTIFHHFHQRWSVAIADALNAGLLPPGLSALIEQSAGGVEPDVLAVERRPRRRPTPGGTATAPRTRLTVEVADQERAGVRRANRVAIRHRLGEVVCVIEVVSPGNKSSRARLRKFLDKTHQFMRAGVHLLLVDPFPPGPRDPHTLHKLIWDEYEDVPFAPPADEPLLQAAYRVRMDELGPAPTAYLEPLRVGSALTDMPAWIDPDEFVEVPLEAAYRAAWASCPPDYRHLVEYGRLPDE